MTMVDHHIKGHNLGSKVQAVVSLIPSFGSFLCPGGD